MAACECAPLNVGEAAAPDSMGADMQTRAAAKRAREAKQAKSGGKAGPASASVQGLLVQCVMSPKSGPVVLAHLGKRSSAALASSHRQFTGLVQKV